MAVAVGHKILLLFLVPIISSSYLFSLPAATSSVELHTNSNDSISELVELKLKISNLESVLEENFQNLYMKMGKIEEQEKLIHQMSHEIHLLQSAASNLKGDSLRADERVIALEEEVQSLWAASRRSNYDIHILETKVRDAGERLEQTTAQAEKMADIVTEQWIQIQRLEQALHITKTRAIRARRRVMYSKCSFLKFMSKVYTHHLQKALGKVDGYGFYKMSSTSSYFSQVWHQLQSVFAIAKEYHHQLQHFIKQEMDKNELTTALANMELVFVLASAVIVFPIICSWVFFSSRFL